jgi:hypothetical protein
MNNALIRTILKVYLMLLFLGFLPKPCYSYEEISYSLQLTLNVSCAIPFQTVSPAVVSFELRNIGNETFNGILTLEGKTDKQHSWNPVEFNISNLTKNAVYRNSTPFSTPDEGLYWFTVKIEPNQTLSTIKLYADSQLEDEGFRVSKTSSIFIHSFTNFIAIVGIVVVATVTIAVAIYSKKKKEMRRHEERLD